MSQDLYSDDPARGWIPWGALAPFLLLVFVIVTALLGDELIAKFVNMDAKGNPLDATALVAFTLVPFSFLLVLLLTWVRFVERRPVESIGLRGEHKVRDFLRGHALGLAGIAGIVLAIWIAGGLKLTAVAPVFSQPAFLVPILLLLFTFALQASAEEILFRGWLLSVLAKKFNVPIAIVVSSALFSLLHFGPGQHWLVTLGTFLFALFACAWVLRARNVLGIMGWHAGWNWLLAVGFGLPVTGLDVGIPGLFADMQPVGAFWLTGGAQGPEGSVVCLGYFIFGIAAMLLQPGKATIAS